MRKVAQSASTLTGFATLSDGTFYVLKNSFKRGKTRFSSNWKTAIARV
jgi:hypothetical protein